MENVKKIEINGREYICYKSVLTDYDNCTEINNILETLRNNLRGMRFTTEKELVEFEIYIYQSDEINAFSIKSTDGYVIALSGGIFKNLKHDLKQYLSCDDIRSRFFGKKRNIDWHVNKIFWFIVLFVALHEYFHILDGHCNTDYVKNSVEVECYRKMKKSQSRYNQILEFDADYCAVRSSMHFIAEKTEYYEKDVMMFGFGLYFIFLKFQENAYENFDTLKELDVLSHPPAGIRLVYAFFILTYELKENISDDYNYYDLLNKIMDLCIYFDRVYYDAETIDLSLFAIAFTQKGLKHIEMLHNGWENCRKFLQKYACINLKETEKLDISNKAWITPSGEMNMESMIPNILSLNTVKAMLKKKKI